MVLLSKLRLFTASTSAWRNRLLLTLCSPDDSIFLKQPVESVTLPGSEGAFTVTNHHSQVVSQLRNGLVTVRQEGLPAKNYFLTDGFLIYQRPKDESGCCLAEVYGVAVVPTETLCKEKAVQTLQELLQTSSASTDVWEKTRASLGQDLCSAVIRHAN